MTKKLLRDLSSLPLGGLKSWRREVVHPFVNGECMKRQSYPSFCLVVLSLLSPYLKTRIAKDEGDSSANKWLSLPDQALITTSSLFSSNIIPTTASSYLVNAGGGNRSDNRLFSHFLSYITFPLLITKCIINDLTKFKQPFKRKK